VPHAAPAVLQRRRRRRGARRACPGQRAARAAPRRRPRGRSARPTAAARSPRRRAPRPAAAPSPAARAGRAGRRTRPPSRRCPRPACPPPLRSAVRARSRTGSGLGCAAALGRCGRASAHRPAARAAGQPARPRVHAGPVADSPLAQREAGAAVLSGERRQARLPQRAASPRCRGQPHRQRARRRRSMVQRGTGKRGGQPRVGGAGVGSCERAEPAPGGTGRAHLLPRAPGCAGCWPRHRRGASAPSLRWPAAAVFRSASPPQLPARRRRSARARPAQRAPRFTRPLAEAAAASCAAGSAQHGRVAGSCGLPAVTNRSSAVTGAAQSK
jgi:hypothetical protein